MRFRPWNAQLQKWGSTRDETTNTRNRKEALALLHEREKREERRRQGLEAVLTDERLGKVLTRFIDESQICDKLKERNRRATHPVLGHEVRGTAWWCRTCEFARDVFRFYGDCSLSEVADVNRLQDFSRWLAREGGGRGTGVGQSTQHKALTWFRRFCARCVEWRYFLQSPFAGFRIPSERVERQDRILGVEEREAFWSAYQQLGLKARARVGLVLFTGARDGEINTIKVADVSARFGTVRRRIWKAGDAADKVVRVPESVMTDLQDWIDKQNLTEADRLFPVRCQSGVKFLRRWGTSMRGLRRSVLDRLREEGVDLATIQHVAGHRKLTTTQRYLGVGENHANDALARLNWKPEPSASPTPREKGGEE